MNSFGWLRRGGELRGCIKHWHREESPQKLWGPPGSPPLSSHFAFSKDHRTNDTEQSRKQPSLPWEQGQGERAG